MVINSIFPYINFFVLSYLPRYLKRALDSGKILFWKHWHVSSTKKKTIQQFVDLYAGPELQIHFRYSSILNMVFATFMHGMALPILFPIALFGMINIFVSERFLLAYYYRQPPLYDNKLNNAAWQYIKYAPLGMLLMGYWYLGNRQMFFNEINTREKKFESPDPDHHAFDFSKGVNHTIPLLICVVLICF